jgi:hypothetical protein
MIMGSLQANGRFEAAKLLGLAGVPVVRLSHLSEDERRAYVLADNRLAEKAGWDREILAIELQELIALNFDIDLAGFAMPEIDLILDEAREVGEPAGPEDMHPEMSAGPAVSRAGDLWIVGNHRLLCGDARSAGDYARVLDKAKAQFVFTDPPYNVPIDGHVCGLGRIRHRDFAMGWHGQRALRHYEKPQLRSARPSSQSISALARRPRSSSMCSLSADVIHTSQHMQALQNPDEL